MTLADRVLARYVRAHAIQPGTRLFHRSPHDFQVGDIIEPGRRGRDLPSWQGEIEHALEQVRRKDYPDKPSRYECVYTSVVPRARFTGRGKLYVVEPLGGKSHVGDSRIVDQMFYRLEDVESEIDPRFEDRKHNLAEAFWESNLSGTPMADIEVMLERAVVVEVPDSPATPLKKGDQVTFGPGVRIPVTLLGEEEFGTGGKPGPGRTYYTLGHMRLTTEDTVERLDSLRGVRVVDDDLRTITVEVGTGFTGTVTLARGGEPGQTPHDDKGYPYVKVEPLRKAAPTIPFKGLAAGAFWRALRDGRIRVH